MTRPRPMTRCACCDRLVDEDDTWDWEGQDHCEPCYRVLWAEWDAEYGDRILEEEDDVA